MPTVSIITPVYNASAFLNATIASILSQTFTDWEWLLVIDHKSTDSSLQMATELSRQDPRVKVFTSPECTGVSANRNYGLERAQGNYVALVDADDLWHPNKLKRQLEFARGQNAVFTFHAYEKISASGEPTGQRVQAPDQVTYSKLLADNCIGCSTVMMERNWLGARRFEAEKHEDFRLWLDLLRDRKTKARGLNEVLSQYRLVQGSLSSNKAKSANWRWEILIGREKLPKLTALYYFAHYAMRAVLKRISRS